MATFLPEIAKMRRHLKTTTTFFSERKDRAQIMIYLLTAPVLSFPYFQDQESQRFFHETGRDAVCQEFMTKLHHHVLLLTKTSRIRNLYELCKACFYTTPPVSQETPDRAVLSQCLQQIPLGYLEHRGTTYLDPSAGKGIHVMELFRVLMKTLSKTIPEEDERREHILSYAIRICDKDAYHVQLWRSVFVLMGGDALQCEHTEGDQPPEVETKVDVVLVHGQDTLALFRKSPQWLRKGGFVCATIPPIWRSPSASDPRCYKTRDLWALTTRFMTPHWVWMTTAGVDFCLFEWKDNVSTTTQIRCLDGRHYKRDLRNYMFLFGGDLDYFDKILVRIREDAPRVQLQRFSPSERDVSEKMTVVQLRELCKQKKIRGYSTKKKAELVEMLEKVINDFNSPPCKMMEWRTKEYVHAVVHTLFKDGRIKKRLWCKKPSPEIGFGKKKVFFSRTSSSFSMCYFDWDGSLGGTENTPAILVDDLNEGEDIVDYFRRPTISQKFKRYADWSTSTIHINLLPHFRKRFYLVLR